MKTHLPPQAASPSFPTFQVSSSPSLAAFDPSLPQDGALVIASVLRDQFNGLAGMVEAVPVINAASVDEVTTLPPGDPAQAAVSVLLNALHFTFAIPRGQDRQAGQEGATGPQGPPFASAIVDGVTTLPAGSMATVTVGFDGTNVHFTFGIPEGQQGGQGAQGEQGPPGEVTNADLNSAIGTAVNGTSSNSNAVNVAGLSADATYNQAQLQTLMDKVDELINTLHRP